MLYKEGNCCSSPWFMLGLKCAQVCFITIEFDRVALNKQINCQHVDDGPIFNIYLATNET